MDNASKNATDMISRLTMQYNRGRQAVITNELIDIITGTLYASPFRSHHFMFVFQVLVRSERGDYQTCGRCRVLGRRLLHVVLVPLLTIVPSFYPALHVARCIFAELLCAEWAGIYACRMKLLMHGRSRGDVSGSDCANRLQCPPSSSPQPPSSIALLLLH